MSGITKPRSSAAWAVLAVICCMLTALCADTFGDFYYTDDGTSITITGYPSDAVGAVVIPSTIAGKPVTCIGRGAFSTCFGLTSVTIPASVTSIGSEAFYGCVGLTGITLPGSVTSIADSAFASCTGLTSITIPPGVTSIGMSAFESCYRLTSVILPKNITSVADNTFSNCTGLARISIPAGVTSIGSGAFYYCTSLTAITIPASVTSIGMSAFYACTGLTSVTIPSGVTTIGLMSFYACSKLTSVSIPASVTSIGHQAFDYCSSLASITIPASVTSIGAYAFSSCSSLTAITVDPLNSVYSSSDGVLFNKNQTTLIQWPGGKAGNVTIPSSVTTIGSYAFFSCSGLTSVTIPANVTSIASSAFLACSGLTEITVDPLNTIYSSVGGVLYDKNQTTLIQWPGGKAGSVTVPSSITNIGSGAFYYCTGLTSVTIPSGVSIIGDLAFYYCSGLTSVSFLGNAPSMGSNVFLSSSGVTVYYFNGAIGFTSPTWQGRPSVNMGDSTPAANWLLSNNLPYNASLQTDPDGDGVSLLMAYALNLDPKQNLANSMPRQVLAANQLSMTFYAGTAGVTYAVESSTDLQNWSAAGVVLSAPDGNNRRTATVPVTGPQRYMRLVASY